MEFPLKIYQQTTDNSLNKGLWIVVLHATRIPPHVGLLFDGMYFSFNLKGLELNVSLSVLLRTIELQNIKTLFIKIRNHPVFSIHYLREVFENELKNYTKLTAQNTCFKPVKLFFEENFLFCSCSMNYLFELFPALDENNMIENTIGLHLNGHIHDSNFYLKEYSIDQIKSKLSALGKEWQ